MSEKKRMKVHVIYHRADMDGKFSGAVCYHWLTKAGGEVTLSGWDFGDPIIDVGYDNDIVYVVDLPVTCVTPEDCKIVWIDHHKSSIEATNPNIPGYRIDGVAACRLAWQWFQQGAEGSGVETGYPTKPEYVNRTVKEPIALTYAGEYDIWDKRDPAAEQFQFGLYTRHWTPKQLAESFFELPFGASALVGELVQHGEAIMVWQKEFATGVCKSRGYYVELEGNKYWALASVHARNSSWFPDEVVPTDANGLLCYRIEGDGFVKISLYNRVGCEDIDHSVIAVKYGGGGHRGACGFQVTLNEAIDMGIVK